ncbi:MAG: T9SS type A sorting domain-containing protein [Ferruginibacter sp.]
MRKSTLVAVLLFVSVSIRSQSPHAAQLYGMQQFGGAPHKGTIFHYTPSTKTVTIDYEFQVKVKGKSPKCDIVTANGKYYGTTTAGGNFDAGVIFEWDSASGNYTEPYHFTGTGGSDARGGMVLYNGKFYGLTNKGGVNDFGVIYEWDFAANAFIKKIDMDSVNGKNPDGSLTLINNKFYGFTRNGGIYNKGVLFEWDPSTNIYTKKFDFDSIKGSGPVGKLVPFGNKLYAMTNTGGTSNKGTIYEWDYINNTVTKKIDFNGTNGQRPTGYLALYNNKFYGMTYEGGIYQLPPPNDLLFHAGVIFEWNPVNNAFSKKKDLASPATATTSQISGPMASLALRDGIFWGTTTEGIGHGRIFSWSPVTNILKEQYYNDVMPQNNEGACEYWAFAPGYMSYSTFLVSGNKLIGTSSARAGGGAGSIYEYLPDSIQVTRAVHMLATDGSYPSGNLTRVGNKLFGVTRLGGNNHAGNIIEWDMDTKQFAERFQFDGYNTGIQPQGSITYYNGKFYGMNSYGKPTKDDYYGYWGIRQPPGFFSWDTQTNEYKFFDDTIYTVAPFTLLNGKLYTTQVTGTEISPGVYSMGAILQFNPETGQTVNKGLLEPGAGISSSTFGEPANGITYYNGKFYGMTSSNGFPGEQYFGTIYEWDTTQAFTTNKITFDIAKGNYPMADLVLVDSLFYGMTTGFSTLKPGTFFKWNPRTNIFEKKMNAGFPGTPTYSEEKFYFTVADGYIEEFDPATDTISYEQPIPSYPDWGPSGPFQWAIGLCGSAKLPKLLEVIPNKDPLLSDVPLAQTICSNQTGTASFKITDADEDTMHFTISSTNTTLLPLQNISVTHTDSVYTIAYYGTNNQTGSSTITVNADDGYGGKVNLSFPVTINSAAGPQPCVPVPVTLLNFNAEAKENMTLLSWQTAAELNVKEYVLERSSDGFSFKKIGMANAFNNVIRAEYYFTDKEPFPGINYYRIKCVDKDGKFTYSYVRMVKFDRTAGIVKVYPNPAKNILTVDGIFKNRRIIISLTDFTGRTVYQAVHANTRKIEIPVNKLQKAAYLLTVYDGDRIINRKIIKE